MWCYVIPHRAICFALGYDACAKFQRRDDAISDLMCRLTGHGDRKVKDNMTSPTVVHIIDDDLSVLASTAMLLMLLGTGVRDYIHVSDLADAHVLALSALIEAPKECLTMNCGYGRGFSVTEVLDAVDRVAGVKINRKIEGRRAGDPDALTADNSRIRARLPWTPAYEDLDIIVTHALAWEKELERRAR